MASHILKLGFAGLAVYALLLANCKRMMRVAEAKYKPQGQFVDVDGASLHYVRRGNGAAVVLLHGNDGSVFDFTMSCFDKLAERYDTIAIDRPGHGYSTYDGPSKMFAEDQAELFRNALKKLGVEKPVLVAHSWAGAQALAYAVAHADEIRGIVMLAACAYPRQQLKARKLYHSLLNPFVTGMLMPLLYAGEKARIQRGLRKAFAPHPVPDDYMDMFMSLLFRPEQIAAACRDETTLNQSLANICSQYDKIDCPVEILTADQDLIINYHEHADKLHEVLPQSVLKVLPHQGHELQFTAIDSLLESIESICRAQTRQHDSVSGKLP